MTKFEQVYVEVQLKLQVPLVELLSGGVCNTNAPCTADWVDICKSAGKRGTRPDVSAYQAA